MKISSKTAPLRKNTHLAKIRKSLALKEKTPKGVRKKAEKSSAYPNALVIAPQKINSKSNNKNLPKMVVSV